MKQETKTALLDFIDAIETDIGELEGFEVKLEHKIVDGERQSFATVKEFVIYYIHKETIDI